MLTTALAQGAATPGIAVGGPTLRIVAHPSVAVVPHAMAGGPASSAATLLVAFDRRPSLTDYDAVVPYYSDVLVSVPEGSSKVYVLFPAGIEPVYPPAGNALQVFFGYEWLPVAFPPRINALPEFQAPGSNGLTVGQDATTNAWPPGALTPVLLEGLGATGGGMMRPPLGPAQITTYHAALAISTLTPVADVKGLLGIGPYWSPGPGSFPVIVGVILSLSGAATYVLGTAGLTIGAPGIEEQLRVATTGALPPTYFPLGAPIALPSATAGAMQHYASAAVTVDATVILA